MRRPDAGELARSDVHTRRVTPAEGLDAPLRDGCNDRPLDALDEPAHAQPGSAKVEQRIHHELPGAVVRHLAAAIDLHHGNIAGREQMLGPRVHAEREDWGVLEEPDLVGSIGPALIDEPLHRPPRRLVGDAAEPAQDGPAHGQRLATPPAPRPALLRARACSAR